MAGRTKKSMFDDIKEIGATEEKPVKETKAKKVEIAPETSNKTGIVKTDSWLNIRSAASTDSSIVGQLKNGEKVTIYKEENGFGKISDINELWVKLEFVNF